MRREWPAAVVVVLLGGATAVHADMRGETVCGIPPTEPVLVVFSGPGRDGGTSPYACGLYGCDWYQGTPAVTEDEYACDVRVSSWNSGEVLDARLYRLGPLGYSSLDPDDEIDPDFGPSDARYYIYDVIAGGGSAAPPEDRCVYVGGGDLLESLGDGRFGMSRMLREAHPEETERLLDRLRKVREVSDANLSAVVGLLYDASVCLDYYWDDGWEFVQKVGRETARVLNLVMRTDDPAGYYLTSDPLGLLLGGDREERFMKIVLPVLDGDRRDEFERHVETYKNVLLYGNG